MRLLNSDKVYRCWIAQREYHVNEASSLVERRERNAKQKPDPWTDL